MRSAALTMVWTVGAVVAFSVFPANAQLIGHWSMDETSGGISGDGIHGNDGAWQNNDGVTGDPLNLSWSPGVIGNAATVDDVDNGGNYFKIDAIPQLVGGAGWTIAAWIQPDDQTDTHYNGVFMSRSANGGGSWGLALEKADDFYHTDNRMNSGGGVDSPNNIEIDGNWLHVANTWDATTGVRHVYINGALVASSPADGDNGNVGAITDSGTWFIGYDDCCGGTRDFDGSIDDVAFYNIPLSSGNVNAIYEGGLAGTSAADVSIVVPEPTSFLIASLLAAGLLVATGRSRRRA